MNPSLHQGTITCARCGWPLAWKTFNSPDFIPCASCGTPTLTTVFPALVRESERGTPAAAVATDSQSTCFYHADKQAATVCDDCGRFLCSLCDIHIGSRHLCSPCLQVGARKGRVGQVEKGRTLHDTAALVLSAIPVVSLITAPMAIFIVIRHWSTPVSLLPRSKARFIIALILAAIQIVVWPVIFITLTHF